MATDLADLEIEREHRVEMAWRTAEDLIDGHIRDREAAAFLGAAIMERLMNGGDLERDHLRIVAPRGSHLTPEAIARNFRRLHRR